MTKQIAEMIPSVTRAVVTYGLSEHADIRGTDLMQDGRIMHFRAHLPNQSDAIEVSLNLPGVHNVRNALGAIAIAWELGLDLTSIVEQPGLFRRYWKTLCGSRPVCGPEW